jgi:hypothetical protein
MPGGLAWADGSVLGVAVHGVLESWNVLHALFGRVPEHSLDSSLDRLTDVVMANLDARFVEGLVGLNLASRAGSRHRAAQSQTSDAP